MAETVAKSTSLSKLELYSNHITDTGASALAETLAKSISLTELSLFNNQITEAGATKLSAALMRSAKVQRIDLPFNQTTLAGDDALRTAHAAIKAIRPTVWLLGRPLRELPAKLTTNSFISEKDGDHAIWYRVMEFLAKAHDYVGLPVILKNRVRWL